VEVMMLVLMLMMTVLSLSYVVAGYLRE